MIDSSEVTITAKVKVNVDLYSALSWISNNALGYGMHSQGIPQFYLHTPHSSFPLQHCCCSSHKDCVKLKLGVSLLKPRKPNYANVRTINKQTHAAAQRWAAKYKQSAVLQNTKVWCHSSLVLCSIKITDVQMHNICV